MTRIDDVAQTIRNVDREHDLMGGDIPDPKDYARALDTAGHLMPDLPQPTFITEGTVVWKNDGDEVFLEDSEISAASVIRSPERARRVAYAMLAAADYAERNHE